MDNTNAQQIYRNNEAYDRRGKVISKGDTVCASIEGKLILTKVIDINFRCIENRVDDEIYDVLCFNYEQAASMPEFDDNCETIITLSGIELLNTAHKNSEDIVVIN